MTPIVELPDGSGCFTATILSKEEAMALPLKERPLCDRISSEMYHAVFEAIGAASMCWNPRPGDQVFSSEEASEVAVKLCFKIADELEELRAKSESLEEKNLRLEARVEDMLNSCTGEELCKKQDAIIALYGKIDTLTAENATYRLIVTSLEGELGHTVPSGVELPVVAENVLAKSLAAENERHTKTISLLLEEGEVLKEENKKMKQGLRSAWIAMDSYIATKADEWQNEWKHILQSTSGEDK